LHEGVGYVEHGTEPNPKLKRQRVRTLVRALRKLGYDVDIKPFTAAAQPLTELSGSQ
jgi:hypothetical protein